MSTDEAIHRYCCATCGAVRGELTDDETAVIAYARLLRRKKNVHKTLLKRGDPKRAEAGEEVLRMQNTLQQMVATLTTSDLVRDEERRFLERRERERRELFESLAP